MRKPTPFGKVMSHVLGSATVALTVLTTLVLAGLAVSALIGTPLLLGAPGRSTPQALPPPFDTITEIGALNAADIPPGPNLAGVVIDEAAAIKLGKAFYWDMQSGSDGQACASCHFLAGADARVTNQLSPGLNSGDTFFNATGSGGVGKSNYTLKAADFPFHKVSNPEINPQLEASLSTVTFDTNDVVSSAGVFPATFVDIVLGQPNDTCTLFADPIFKNVNGKVTRRVEPRNTPTNINSHFLETFFDGRAKKDFVPDSVTGNVLGFRDPDAKILVKQGDGSVLEEVRSFENSSFASQAVGPPLSKFEMSCEGRTFPKIAKKMYSLKPLGLQKVHALDSQLGPLAVTVTPFKGLNTTYPAMIQAAFDPKFWDSDKKFEFNPVAPHAITEIGTGAPLNTNEYTLMEMNFPLFWGLALQLFESKILISGESPFDKFARGDTAALTQQQKDGLTVFAGQGRCINCHNTALFSGASTLHLIAEAQEEGLVERMLMGDQDRGPALYDNGFYNIGVRPTTDDILGGAEIPTGEPLSFTKQYIELLLGQNVPDSFQIDECTFEIRFGDGGVTPLTLDGSGIVTVASGDAGDQNEDGTTDPFPVGFQFDTITCLDSSTTLRPTLPSASANPAIQEATIRNFRTSVHGNAKVPTLRNVELTGPYFHNGGQGTLEQVIDFYNRGGDFPKTNERDLDPDIQPLFLTFQQRADLVAFLKSLTDPRVLPRKAPFDSPSITIFNGHKSTDGNNDGRLDDLLMEIPATGRNGGAVLKLFYKIIDQQKPTVTTVNLPLNTLGQAQYQINVKDLGGLQKITVTTLTNGTLTGHQVLVDYAQGTQASVPLILTKIDQTLQVTIKLTVVDLVGNTLVWSKNW